jgi:ribonuclease P protein component
LETERFFLKRQNRITTTKQFGFLFARAKKIHQRRFSFYCHPNNLEIARLGLVVAKRNQKKAVHRNRIKRIIRECFRRKQKVLNGQDLIVVVRCGVENVSSLDLQRELCEQMERIAAW